MTLAFWIFAILSVISAVTTILHRNPIYSALSLVATLFLIAGMFVLLDAHLVAFLQVIVYAGAIMVLFLFVIMLISAG
ncbi:MAG: NADH-quinone oxidoreductase subunit J, partial [Alphaproteobacteria bacterium]